MSTPPLSKLRFRCRRGMLELDVMLARFLDSGFDSLTDSEKLHFDEILQLQDPELNLLITGHTKAPEQLESLITKIIASNT